jgi:hypothetical protein
MAKDPAAGQHHRADRKLADRVKKPVVSGPDNASPAERGAPEYYAKDRKPSVAHPLRGRR